jgi:Tetratricopeptide repeat
VCTRIGNILFVLLLCGRAVVSAQQPQRLRLERDADTNDWRAYYAYGFKQLGIHPSRSDSAFYWASRLAPNRAEPLYGRWVAFWLRNVSIFEDYLLEQTPREEVAHVARADTFLIAALWRNPLLVRTLELRIYDQLPGDWSQDEWTQGWLEFGRGHPDRAADLWGRLLRSHPDRRPWVRYDRAIVLAALQHYDSAIGDLHFLVAGFDRLRLRRDSLVRVIDRKEYLLYGIGLLWLAVPNLDSATAAFQEALVADLSYAPAHEGLAEIALARGDPTGAAREFQLAVDLIPRDVWYRDRLGIALAQAGHLPEAAAQLDSVTRQEPLFSDGFYQLGIVLDAAGQHAAAATAFHQYLALAARVEEGRIRDVQQRLANIGTTH